MDSQNGHPFSSVITNESIFVPQEQSGSSRPQLALQEIVQVEEDEIFISVKVIEALDILTSLLNKVTQRNLLEGLDKIKRRECMILKCQIFAKTIGYFLKRKTKKIQQDVYESLKESYKTRSELSQSLYGCKEEIKQSIETSLGTESVMCSLRLQKPTRVLCDNCRKQIVTQNKTAKIFILYEVESQQNLFYDFKNPQILQPGIFAKDEKIPKKLVSLLADQVFSTVNDQSASFINIESSQIMRPKSNSSNSQSLSLKLNKPVQELTFQSLNNTQPFQPVSNYLIPPPQPTPNTLFTPQQIQKSFIERLLTQQSQHTPRNISSSPVYPSLFEIPRIEQSQIIYNNNDSKDVFMKSIDMNRRNQMVQNVRIVTQPIKFHKFNSRFSDSEIKKHISQYRSRSTRPPQKIEYIPKKQKQEVVGGPRGHKPTFFQTAFYFN